MKAIKTTFNDVSRWQSEGSVSQVTGAIMAGLLWLGTATGLHAQPVIPSNQPSNQIACLGGGCLTYSVAATGTPPLSYQWRIYTNASGYRVVPGETNDTIVLCNLPTNNTRLRVVVTDGNGLSSSSRLAYMTIVPPPSITQQPKTPSLGTTVVLSVAATAGAPSLSYQWQFQGTNLPGQTQATLTLQTVSLAQMGNYTVVVSNIICGISVSAPTPLDVDATFTKVTTGVIVTDEEGSVSGNWADYDNDGYVDLFVANTALSGTTRNTLYHNDRGTGFSRVAASPVATDAMRVWAAAWADYNNDGNVDLIAADLNGGTLAQRLYRNNGDGSFTAVVDSALLSNTTRATCPWWIDYDNDGFLDLFMTKGMYESGVANDCLFRNDGAGTFKNMTAAEVGPILNDQRQSFYCFSADYDNDGRQELTVLHEFASGATNLTWRYQANGTFVPTAPIGIPEIGNGASRSWGDFNNDGWLDAFSADLGVQPTLFRNLGAGGFTDVTAAVKVTTPAAVYWPIWGDYDNDGWLDVFYTGAYWYSATTLNGLFHNNRDGTFTQILSGSPVYDLGRRMASSWTDYDNDGFLDLFIAVGNGTPAKNLLYRNNGNTNHWLKIKLDGRASNRSGIGAKVRLNATIGGTNFWQMREISCENSFAGQNGLLAHFGLGDATNVTTLRIEWPSGIVQELPDVAANQSLTVVESQSYGGQRPALTGVNKTVSGLHLTITEPDAMARYLLEASTDLTSWTKLMARTSTGGTTNFLDSRMTNYTSRFYRLQVP